MRQILFRGRCKGEKTWHYGNIVTYDGHVHIHERHTHYRVDGYTLGQWTGLSDWNGQKIFEDDIVFDRSTGRDGKIAFVSESGRTVGEPRFVYINTIAGEEIINSYSLDTCKESDLQIIGNTFDGMTPTDMSYPIPCVVACKGLKVSEQLSKVYSEYLEVKQAFDKNEIVEMEKELVDLQIACSTLLFMLGNGEEERKKLTEDGNKKNKARGYW